MKLENENIISDCGKVLFFSIKNFVQDICIGDACFVCGAKKDSTVFSDEHVIPRWVLKKHDLFDRDITLPNGKTFRYSKYKVPCCKSCNSMLGNNLEQVISKGFEGSHEDSERFLNENRSLVFRWFCLLLIKTNLSDKNFRKDYFSEDKISDSYNWDELHHIHCLARSIYTNVDIDEDVYGSMFIYPATDFDDGEVFDYVDLNSTGVVMVRIGGSYIICVFNDNEIVSSLIRSRTDRITGKLNSIQARELYARITYENMRIVDKPKFSTEVTGGFKNIGIRASVLDSIRIAPHDEELLGSIMYPLVKDLLFKPKNLQLAAMIQEQVKAIQKGQWTFLFDSNGKFLSDAMKKIEVEEEDEFLNGVENGTEFLSK